MCPNTVVHTKSLSKRPVGGLETLTVMQGDCNLESIRQAADLLGITLDDQEKMQDKF